MSKRVNRRLRQRAIYSAAPELGAAGADLTASVAELNTLDGLTATLAELNQLDSTAYVGTLGTGVTAAYYALGPDVTAVLTLTNVALTVGSSAALGVGVLIFTLPAGNITIEEAFMSCGLSGVTTTTDTPDVGLGTVIASGAVSVLGGTATFENIITGQTAADTNGTDTIAAAAPNLNVLTGGAHTVHFNAADTWGANADADGLVNGTVVLRYRYNEA